LRAVAVCATRDYDVQQQRSQPFAFNRFSPRPPRRHLAGEAVNTGRSSYPIGEVSTQPLPNAQPNVPAAGHLTFFGGNQAQDLQLDSQRLGQAADNVFPL
jgi:hypothetical protein